jgi:hypothetical protein
VRQHTTAVETTSTTVVLTPTPAPRNAYTNQQVLDALHRATHDILRATNAGEGLDDALDLMINATVGYLAGQAQNPQDVADQHYENSPATILG